ncbi:hypothetical protein M2352_002076 [Azospirillum fermentarium]|uniref:hypothetical protein n=1 Tax=Azospirillum fermentarium TaxID=1233114 RepID=UPI0022279AFF|nr:hypothetical protein [Azospirillum fermentarium]MCW2246485.1 hypothetical protein [Azospirillum fermentarium]
MSAIIIDLAEKRRERDAKRRADAARTYDEELRRRLALYLETEGREVEPIQGAPYF